MLFPFHANGLLSSIFVFVFRTKPPPVGNMPHPSPHNSQTFSFSFFFLSGALPFSFPVFQVVTTVRPPFN